MESASSGGIRLLGDGGNQQTAQKQCRNCEMTFHFVLLLSADHGCALLIFHSVCGTRRSRGKKVPCSRGSIRARRDQQRRMLVAPCQMTGTGSLLRAISDAAGLN